VPETVHIRAHPCISTVGASITPPENLLQIDGFSCCTRQMAGLIAMQKVEGSNPFSRFLPANLQFFLARQVGSFVAFWALEFWNQDRIFAIFGHWCPK
jgi:hypothetical protein